MQKNYLNNTRTMVLYNFKTLVRFEMVYKLLLGLLFMPLATSGFSLTMKATGYTYLTLENIGGFLLNPLSVFLLLLNVIFLTLITLFDISTLIIIFDVSHHGKKITAMDAVKISLHKCRNLLRLKNVPVAFFVLFLIPFLNFGIGSNVITSIRIPEFIMDYIRSNGTLLLLYLTVYLFLLSLLSKWLYALHYMVIEDKDFREARRASKQLIRGSRLRDKLKIFFAQLLLAVIYILFLFTGIFLIFSVNHSLRSHEVAQSVLITLLWMFIGISLIVSANVSTGVSYAIISGLFYKHREARQEETVAIAYDKVPKARKKHPFLSILNAAFLVFLIVCGSGLTYQVITGRADLNIEFVREMEITAHRGASIRYPENTMAAFRGAKELGADWIELDVQQTKDGQIVVCHDTNLSRTTGVNREIIQMTYEEISELDAGSFFGDEFRGERIPLLSEVLEFAGENDMKLNIELKPTGKETDFEKQVVELIEARDFEDRCVVTSQVYRVLENVKKSNPNIKTVYVMSIAIGNVTDAEWADAFSVEASNVNAALVSRVHNAGKELYVWTVNTEESINKMIDMNVDNIITDNIELGRELILKSRNSNLINEFFKLFQ